jgi:hypothetical protein
MNKINIKVMAFLIGLYSFYGFSQNSSTYNTIETKNVAYYNIKEIAKLTFSGTTKSYTVSDLSLISKDALGPNKIRIIIPIYNKEAKNTHTYYTEIKNLNSEPGFNQKATTITEIKIDNERFIIPENQKIEKESLAIVIENLVITELYKVAKNTEFGEKGEYVNISITDTYERVAKKGYKSVPMFKEMANKFYFSEQMEKAAKWYEELFAMTNDLEPVYYYRFGDALRKSGKTINGEVMIKKFNQLSEE